MPSVKQVKLVVGPNVSARLLASRLLTECLRADSGFSSLVAGSSHQTVPSHPTIVFMIVFRAGLAARASLFLLLV